MGSTGDMAPTGPVANGLNGSTPHTNGHSHNDTNSTHESETLAEPIAIVGMAMRLPGGVRNAESFWSLLVNKKSARSRVPKTRYNVDAFYGPGKAGHVATEYGYFLEDVDLANIDTSFWSMTKQEAEVMDPQQRLALEIVYECLENAGVRNWRGQNIGCYMGSFGEDWLDLELKDDTNTNMYRMAGYSDFAISNRVSYEFGFKGPSMTIRTACSASLTGLHEACMSLARGDCNSAIVGGTSVITAPRMTIALSDQGVISPTGSCKTFDANADGYARGEGVSAIYVKRLSDAIRDSDTVRAVIRSTCVNSDGKTAGLTMPSTEGHEALMRRAYLRAGISDFSETAMIECHGTGTKAGDPIEAKAVAKIFGGHGIYIGSVKPNLGHSEGNSGLSSVIKMVLALENKTIPPNINFKTPNPAIPFKEAKINVPVEPTPWPAGKAERVGVNSFGIGGANSHIILESAASFGLNKPAINNSPPKDAKPSLLVLSAQHPDALRQSVKNHEAYSLTHPSSLKDMSYTLAAKRETLSHRAFCVASPSSSTFEMSPIIKSGSPYNLIYTFTGQGAQWAQMGKELFESEPVFQQSVRQLDAVLAGLLTPPPWTLEDEILHPKSKSRLSEAEFSQPCCTAIQVGIVDLLKSWNVKPSAVTGHSSGEMGAAYASEAITASEAILMAYFRGQVTKGLGKIHTGGMAAIGLGPDQVTPYLLPGVIIGCENSPSSVTLTGDIDVLEEVMTNIREAFPDTLVRALRVECAYHSHHMKTVAENYLSMIQSSVVAKAPIVPFYSSVTGQIITQADVLGPAYWVQNLVSPVLFYPAISQVLATLPSPKCFVEIGPHSALAGPIRQAFRGAADGQTDYVATLVRNSNAVVDLLNTAGNLWLRGVDVDFGRITTGGRLLTDLPSYAWHYEGRYWSESRISKDWRLRRFAHHDILGTRVSQSTDIDPSWRNILRLDDVPWIRDHEIAGNALFPGAGFVAMAGLAVGQLDVGGSSGGYTVRRVNISAALVVNGSKSVEVVTNLRPVRLTSSLDSVWYDFTVSSLNGETWIKHVSGQVKAGVESQVLRKGVVEPLEREVSSARWYGVMKRFGLNYGPRFRLLKDISAAVEGTKAVASMSKEEPVPKESPYQLHPATLDATFQLLMTAAFKGVPRLFDKLSVPTYIEELSVRPPKGPIQLEAEAISTPSGLVGSLVGVSDGETVISLKNLHLSPLGDNGDATSQDPHAAIEQEWDRDINFLDVADLIHAKEVDVEENDLLEKYTAVCMAETSAQLQNAEASKIPHMNKFRDWLTTQQDKFLSMTSSERRSLIHDLHNQLSKTKASQVVTAIHQIYTSGTALFNGTVEAHGLLSDNDILAGVYDYIQQLWDSSEFFRLSGHTKPNMRILEIGAGTSCTTNAILPHLVSSRYGERMYSTYAFTDINPDALTAASERFKNVPGMEYTVLDISQDPIEQGFEASSFDLIVASNTLYTNPNLHASLSNIKKLLHPRGRLFLQDVNPPTSTKWINFILGPLASQPTANPNHWTQALLSAGFSSTTITSPSNQPTTTIIASLPPLNPTSPPHLTILTTTPTSPSPKVLSILSTLHKKGYQTHLTTLSSFSSSPPPHPPTTSQILSLLDLDAPFFHNMTPPNFTALQSFLSHPTVKSSGLLWVTGASQVHCKDPRYAMTLGFARTTRSEMGIDFATLEVDDFGSEGAWGAIGDVLRGLGGMVEEMDMAPVLEYVWHGGAVQVGKFHWISVNEALREGVEGGWVTQLDIGRPGALQTLGWRQVGEVGGGGELEGGWVEVETRAVGLNFKDVLIAMNIVAGPKRTHGEGGLGVECSGVVTRVGPNVKLAVGDRVITMSPGSFATRLTTREDLCAKIPDSLGFAEAATIPCVYGTVIYSLMDVARLEKGQTVLIHSAAGGVGISAIQIAQMIGAKIYCTVGNPEKVDFLVRNFGIPRDHIFNSRDSSFVSDIMSTTNNRGVDVVLNSLSGELLHASWRCVAEFGTMVEIGKRDFIGQGTLSMDLFEQNRSFHGVELSQVCAQRPVLMNSLLRRAISFFEQGHIKPVGPIKEFPAARVEDAFRYMQKGQHIGKIVVTLPTDSTTPPLNITTSRSQLLLNPNKSYLIVGGLGGLGRSVASWMVEKGARHLLFFSRSAGSLPKSDPYLLELQAQGCSVQTFSGSVAKAADVARVIRASAKPIAGVLQASSVFRDANIDTMTFDDWKSATEPKVQGTWNLHKLLLCQKEPLDFFFLFSSLSGLAGQVGQSNYAAANTFLDAFVQCRHSLGLPASVLDIGVMEDVGFLTHNAELLESLRATTLQLLHEQDLLDSLELMITRSQPPPKESSTASPFGYVNTSQVGIGFRSTMPLSARNNRTLWKRDPRMAVYHNLEVSSSDSLATGSNSSDNKLKQFLSNSGSLLPSEEENSARFLAQEIGETLCGFMMRSVEDLDVNASLGAMGVDSLVSIELRNWMRQRIGVDLTVLDIIGSGNLVELGGRTVEKLRERVKGL